MKKIAYITAALIALAFIVVGCQNVDEEMEAIKQWVLEDTTYFDASTPVDSTNGESSNILMATADSIFWWRAAQNLESPDVDVDVKGDSGWVEWTRHHTAKLNIFAFVPDTGIWVHWVKDFGETAKIRGIFRKTGVDSDPYRGWTLEKISCAVGNSDNSTVAIDSIKITSQANDLLLKPPYEDQFFDLDSLIKFKSLEPVSITLYANGEETVAHLHTTLGLILVRDTFSNTAGVHTGTWNTQFWPSFRFAIFDLMKKSTLWEEEAAYDYDGVLLPYLIKND
ncbi:hypothetical protein JXM67_00080 [candidate division WOR-3 bacterium]|nr:hypothetical protein [candidate division WOR-3 bacterium]